VICGFQDQYMTVFGGLNYLDFRDKGSHIAADAQPFATIEPLADAVSGPLPLLLANTGVKHHSGSAHKPVRLRWLEGDRAVVGAYERLARLARDRKASLLAGDWPALADAMNDNLRIQQGFNASGEACDRLAEVAMRNGALAAKLAGAGQGGTVLVLTFEPERAAAALQDAGAARILYPKPSPGLTIEEL
jgi:galactokinase/mevalonate kinase-like predicted kinase